MNNEQLANIDTVVSSVTGEEGRFNIPKATKYGRIGLDGEILDISQNREDVPGRYGSHSMRVRTLHSGRILMIEGSPYAFIYGQNVITSSDIKFGVVESLRQTSKKFGLNPTKEEIEKWKAGDINLHRVDISANFDLETETNVLATLNQIKRQLIEQGCAVKIVGTTVYWTPKDGKECSIGFYAKGPQMRLLKRFNHLPDKDRLLDECKKILRIEVRLRESALRELGLNMVRNWDENSAEIAFRHYMKKLHFLEVTTGPVTEEELAKLPSRLRPVLALHKAGGNLEQAYEPRTLQRHRNAFKAIGIDLRCPNQPTGTAISLTKLLSPKRAIKSPPEWMISAGLVPQARG